MPVSTNKDHPENSPQGRQAKTDAKAADTSTAEVQARVDEDNARGYRGIEADPTPNEAYTVAGVTAGQPTPETDREQAEAVRKYQTDKVEPVIDGVARNK